MAINITSYNILSSHLGGSDYYTYCRPENLDAPTRLERIKTMLDAEISKKAVICLQEVSTLWAGALHAYFAKAGYHFVTGLYGKRFNGYMGVAIAIPMSDYDVLQVDITTVSDTKRMPKKKKSEGVVAIVLSWIKESALRALKALGVWRPEPSHWKLALDRFNQLVSVRLQAKATGSKPFLLGTYHMPCMFKIPQVMSIHTALSAQHVKRLANGDPYVFVGDFNIKPGSTMYRLLTEGAVEPDNTELPVNEEGDTWKPVVAPMRSAYKEKLGREPEMTIWSKVKEEPEFVDTLDYIFLSNEWTVEDVRPLPTRNQITGPFPIESEPSDHMLLSAALRLID